jgi:HPt (histidine-containing phosphotransfer) domain-containing protein
MSDVLSDSLDRSQIEFLLSLDNGQGAALAEIVAEFLTTSEQGRDELQRALEEGDAAAVERSAHTLKGASLNVGAGALAAVCRAVEMHAREADLNKARGLMARFEAEFTRVRAALRTVAAGR